MDRQILLQTLLGTFSRLGKHTSRGLQRFHYHIIIIIFFFFFLLCPKEILVSLALIEILSGINYFKYFYLECPFSHRFPLLSDSLTDSLTKINLMMSCYLAVGVSCLFVYSVFSFRNVLICWYVYSFYLYIYVSLCSELNCISHPRQFMPVCVCVYIIVSSPVYVYPCIHSSESVYSPIYKD